MCMLCFYMSHGIIIGYSQTTAVITIIITIAITITIISATTAISFTFATREFSFPIQPQNLLLGKLHAFEVKPDGSLLGVWRP